MSHASGWALSARLMSTHFAVLGERVWEAIASFDPETATPADRDQLAEFLRTNAQVLASARASYVKEHAELDRLRVLIANDEKATGRLAERLAAGTIAEVTVTMFCDALEANKARLPPALQADADARAQMAELQKMIDALSRHLAHFDIRASKTTQALAAADAQNRLPEPGVEGRKELAGLPGMKDDWPALHALPRRARSVPSQAAGLNVTTDWNQKPFDQAARIAAICNAVSAFQTAGETALQRLQRLSPKAA